MVKFHFIAKSIYINIYIIALIVKQTYIKCENGHKDHTIIVDDGIMQNIDNIKNYEIKWNKRKEKSYRLKLLLLEWLIN